MMIANSLDKLFVTNRSEWGEVYKIEPANFKHDLKYHNGFGDIPESLLFDSIDFIITHIPK